MSTDLLPTLILLGTVVLVAFVSLGLARWRTQPPTTLKTSGLQGTAIILAFQPEPNQRRATYLRVPVRLAVHIPGLDPFEIEKELTIPGSAIRYLRVGRSVTVWVNPAAPHNPATLLVQFEPEPAP